MSYRFNNGLGAVTCDICNVIIDERLSYAEYQQIYENSDTGDLCWMCLGNCYIKNHGKILIHQSKKYEN